MSETPTLTLSYLALRNMTNLIGRSTFLRDYDRLFASFAEDSGVITGHRTNLNFRMKTDGNCSIAEIEVPGVEPSEVKVKIDGKSLSVETPRGNAYITIGQRVISEEATASLKYGLLTIRIPTRGSKVIEVEVSEN